MKFLIFSEAGDAMGLAIRLHAEGNEARIFTKDYRADTRGKGLVEHTDDAHFGECIVSDCTGSGPILDHLRSYGHRVIGGSSLMDRMESDRGFSDDLMQFYGIKTPDSQSFEDWSEAVEFIKANRKKRWVFKPDGSLSGCIPSYTPSDNEELLEAIDHFKTLLGAGKPQFTLQEFIEGVAVSTEGWFDGYKWIPPFNHTIERKHLMAGDVGPSGGCTGNVVWACDESDPIVSDGVGRLESFLAKHLYCGPIDLNSIVNEDGVWGLEFTPRFGYDAFPTLLHGLYQGEFGRFLWECASGDGPARMDVRDGFAAGIRISIPPWPNEKQPAEAGIPIRGIEPEDLLDRVFPYDMQLQDGKLVTSGGFGIIGVVMGYGETCAGSFRSAYHNLESIKIPDMQYRTDLSSVCSQDLAKLEELAVGR